jgi:hypothetical protein
MPGKETPMNRASTDREWILRELIRWYVGAPGGKMPRRPDQEARPRRGSNDL